VNFFGDGLTNKRRGGGRCILNHEYMEGCNDICMYKVRKLMKRGWMRFSISGTFKGNVGATMGKR